MLKVVMIIKAVQRRLIIIVEWAGWVECMAATTN
jgi:hypothetical protein